MNFDDYAAKDWVVANGVEVHDRPTKFDAHGARIGHTPNRIAIVEFPYGSVEGRAETAQLFAAAPALLAVARKVAGECTVNHLNRCWDGRAGDVIGKHYAGGDACAACHARSVLARLGGAS